MNYKFFFQKFEFQLFQLELQPKIQKNEWVFRKYVQNEKKILLLELYFKKKLSHFDHSNVLWVGLKSY